LGLAKAQADNSLRVPDLADDIYASASPVLNDGVGRTRDLCQADSQSPRRRAEQRGLAAAG